MGEFVDLGAKIKKYYKFTPSELNGFLISVFILAFVISFKDWGRGSNIQPLVGIVNLFNAILIVGLSLLVSISVRKIAALQTGLRAEYKVWMFGLLLALIFAFVSNGNIWILVGGGLMFHHLAGHRLGFFRYGLNYFAVGLSSAVGPISNIILAAIFKGISVFVSNALITKAIMFNLGFAVWSMLPFPPLDGGRMFYGSRMAYALLFFFVVFAAILLYTNIPVWISLVGAALLGVVMWLAYYILVEKGAWGGPY